MSEINTVLFSSMDGASVFSHFSECAVDFRKMLWSWWGALWKCRLHTSEMLVSFVCIAGCGLHVFTTDNLIFIHLETVSSEIGFEALSWRYILNTGGASRRLCIVEPCFFFGLCWGKSSHSPRVTAAGRMLPTVSDQRAKYALSF